jgi:NAD/NADP transhydrogenase alpha subunit
LDTTSRRSAVLGFAVGVLSGCAMVMKRIAALVIVGALGLAAVSDLTWAPGFAMVALVLATINVVGGFLVTDRMLGEFGDKR